FRAGDEPIDPRADAHLELTLRAGALCSDATIASQEGEPAILGDPTEGALVVAAAKAGMQKAELEKEYPRVGEIPFRSETQRMTTIHRTPEGKLVAFVKGGPAVVAEASRQLYTSEGPREMTDELREETLQRGRELAGQALRVLAVAMKEVE